MPLSYFKTYEFIVLANNIYVLSHYANFLALLENDQATDVRVQIGDGFAVADMPKGLSVELPRDKKFKSLTFENTTGTDMVIKVALSIGRVFDNRLVLTSSSVFAEILGELQGDQAFETIGAEKTVGVAAGEILNTNATRKGCIVQSKSSNTGIIYIGFDSTVTSTLWLAELQPGASFSIDDYRGDIWAIATIAAQKMGWGEW